MSRDLSKTRNIGISAHIDSGKTTLTERVLFYSGRIHQIHDVKGSDGVGAVMDHMELERERGITITSAATSVGWQGPKGDDYHINIIDTPGHVDFTVEVERSLRVLDGAVLVLCGVGGVQSQSLTVDRQMKRYHVPRLAFINKLDRTGANHKKVIKDLKEKLKADPIALQIPIGLETKHIGVVDLIEMDAVVFEGEQGQNIKRGPIPAELQAEAEAARATMLEALAMYSDQLMELVLAGEDVSTDLIYKVTRDACLNGATPVLMGSAFKNKGVQLLLDAVTRYLPSPLERDITAHATDGETKIHLEPNPDKPFVGMAFKIVDDPYGTLTFTRVYQGKVEKGGTYYNQRLGKKERFSRILRVHADKKEEIDSAEAGDIVAIQGIDCASGDTYASEPKYGTLEGMFVPEPVMKVAVSTTDRANGDKLSKALQRFRREDPTFQAETDPETNEVILAGMGQLHLEIYVERIRREYKCDLEVGEPKVSYREAPTKRVEFNHKRRKQTGGSGQYGHIVGLIEPLPDDAEENFVFSNEVSGGRIPKEFIAPIEKGFRNMLVKGPIADFPVVKVRVMVNDGSYHDVDSSANAFEATAAECFREYFPKTAPAILEPLMKVTIEVPDKYQGSVTGHLTSKRGIVANSDTGSDGMATIVAEVPLSEMFSYSNDLRSMTSGQGTFEMEFLRYSKTPANVQREIIEARKQVPAGAGA